jgi:hypothetical protein
MPFKNFGQKRIENALLLSLEYSSQIKMRVHAVHDKSNVLPIFFSLAQQPNSGVRHFDFRLAVHTHAVGLLSTTDQRVTQQTLETNIHALCGIRTRDPSNVEVADLRQRRHGHRYRTKHIIFPPNLHHTILSVYLFELIFCF